MPWRFLRAGSRAVARRKLEIAVEGAEHLPRSGPVVIASRHYHHLYDGLAFHALSRRPVHILVTVDWLKGGLAQRAMEALCRAARWPTVVRTDPFSAAKRAIDPAAAQRAFRRAVTDSVALLREGRVLIVFPEGHPTVDPNPTPKRSDDELLPFQPGVVRIAQIAERGGVGRVPIVPVGLSYERGPRWRLTVRYGPPLAATGDPATLSAELERRVRELSGLPG